MTDAVACYRRFVAAVADSDEALARWGDSFRGPERRLLDRYLRRPRVLVAGCGHGRGILELLDRGCVVTAVDREPAMCRRAEAALGGRGVAVRCGELAELSRLVPGQRFHTILALGAVSGGLLLPGSERPAVFAALAGALAEDGVLLLDFVDAGPGPRGEVREVVYRLTDGRELRGCCYWATRGELRRTLEDAGCTVRFVSLARDADEPLTALVARRRPPPPSAAPWPGSG
jgi:SAM-dependent methyltransferase